MGRDSPGPGKYDSFIDNSWNHKMQDMSLIYNSNKSGQSIPKSKRISIFNQKAEYVVGPQSYNVIIDKYNLISKNPNKRAVIGNEPREYDPIKYSNNNAVLIRKGLY